MTDKIADAELIIYIPQWIEVGFITSSSNQQEVIHG